MRRWSTPPGCPGPRSPWSPTTTSPRSRPRSPAAGGPAGDRAGGVDLLRARATPLPCWSWPGSARRTTRCCWSTRRTASGSPAPAAAGWSPSLGLAGHDHVVVTATLSKALGAQGGAVLGSPAVIDAPGQPGPAVHLRHRPRAGGRRRRAQRARGARIARPDLPGGGHRTGRRARGGARASTRRPVRCCRCRCRRRRSRSPPRPPPSTRVSGSGCFRPPSVPDGISRLRITTNAGLTEADWARAAAVLGQVVKEYGAPMSIVVVTGTGTGVGKTVVTAALAVRAAATGSVVVVKPVQTGVGADSDEVADADEVHRLTGCSVQEFTCSGGPARAGHRGPAARAADPARRRVRRPGAGAGRVPRHGGRRGGGWAAGPARHRGRDPPRPRGRAAAPRWSSWPPPGSAPSTTPS